MNGGREEWREGGRDRWMIGERDGEMDKGRNERRKGWIGMMKGLINGRRELDGGKKERRDKYIEEAIQCRERGMDKGRKDRKKGGMDEWSKEWL